MNIIRRIKNNRFVRGLYFGYRNHFLYPKSKFGYYGDNVVLTSPIVFSNPKNVYLYGNNGIGNAIILTTNAKFIMKKNSESAYGLQVITGNHSRIVGIPYRCITENEKPKGMDHDVIVEEDVWIGMNVTILAGVTIGRGTTVAACALVNKSMPPYCVCAGIPAKVIKFYWTIDQILEHESKIYSPEERYTRELLEEIFKKYNK